MKRWIPVLGLALAMIAVATVRPSDARISANIDVRIGSPLPFAVYDDAAPALLAVPGTSVYCAADAPYDMWRYGSFWYVCDEGTWYRSASYRGPFFSVGGWVVPPPVLACAPGYGHANVRVWNGPRGRAYGWYGRGDVRGDMRWDNRRDGRWNGDDRGWSRGDERGWSRGDNRDWQRDHGVYRGDDNWNRDDRGRGWNRDRHDDRNRGDRDDRGDD